MNAVHKEYSFFLFLHFRFAAYKNCLLFLVIFGDTGDVLLLSCYTVDAFKRMLIRGERCIPEKTQTIFLLNKGVKHVMYLYLLYVVPVFFLFLSLIEGKSICSFIRPCCFAFCLGKNMSHMSYHFNVNSDTTINFKWKSVHNFLFSAPRTHPMCPMCSILQNM